MNASLFTKFYIISVILILCIVASINFVVDPLYTFRHNYNRNIKHIDFDERTQKTNFLAYINSNFDAILLGNSRITYINPNDFNIGYKVFNYSVSAMPIDEFETIIDNFITITHEQPKLIILGLDFFQLSQNTNNTLSKKALENTYEPLRKYNNLLSLNNLIFSLKNILLTIKLNTSYDRKQRFYDNTLVKGLSNKNLIPHTAYINELKNTLFIPQDENTIPQLKKLKQKYNKSKFVVFSTPIHSSIYKQWIQNKFFIDVNKQWLTDLVDIFGEVYHFLYINEITEDELNFYDAFHFYPYVGELIANKISFSDSRDDFGILLDKNNIDSYLNTFP